MSAKVARDVLVPALFTVTVRPAVTTCCPEVSVIAAVTVCVPLKIRASGSRVFQAIEYGRW